MWSPSTLHMVCVSAKFHDDEIDEFNGTEKNTSKHLFQVHPPNDCVADTLRWRHNGRDSVSNHQSHHCLLNRLFRRRWKKASKFRVTGLCAMNSPGTGEFPAQMTSNAENGSIWWRHHDINNEHHCRSPVVTAIQRQTLTHWPLEKLNAIWNT